MRLPNPKYEVSFKEVNRKHFYEIEGNLYPSVTAILKIIGGSKVEALNKWSINQALNFVKDELTTHIGQETLIDQTLVDSIIKAGSKKPGYDLTSAADLGTKVHYAIDNYILNGEYPTDSTVKTAFMNFLKWSKEQKIEFVCGDLTVGSKKHGVGGRLDALAIDDKGNLIVFDWKTSKAIYDEYALQVSAYANMFEEQYGLPILKTVIVRFDKEKPIFDFKEVKSIKNSFNAFIYAKKLKEILDVSQFKI